MNALIRRTRDFGAALSALEDSRALLQPCWRCMKPGPDRVRPDGMAEHMDCAIEVAERWEPCPNYEEN